MLGPLGQGGDDFVAHITHQHRHGEPREPGDLSAHNCLFYPRGADQPAWTFERGGKQVERLTVPIAGSFATNNSEALRDAALNHLGIALLPDFSAQAALASGWVPRQRLKIVVGAGLPAKNVNDNAALSGGLCCLWFFREQARSYIALLRYCVIPFDSTVQGNHLLSTHFLRL